MMAIGMEKHSVVRGISAAMGSPNDMVIMPAREFGDFLVADGTDAVLFLPETQQLTALFEIICHFEAKSLLKVDFPGRVVGISCAFNFDVPLDRSIGSTHETDQLTV